MARSSRARASGTAKISRDQLSARSGTVLVVDDDPMVRDVHCRLLRRAGIRVLDVPTPGDVLALLRGQGHFDAIVTDICMPGMDGVTMLREVRRINADIPVVLVTGYPNLDTAVAAMKYGGFRYLAKPVVVDELISVVHEAIGLYRLACLKREALSLLESHRLKEEAWSSVDLQLTEAMARLWMVYQPIVSWGQRSLMGYEALVRSASMTLSNPVLLFDAAERLGRVRELGRCIRRQIACDIEDAPEQALIFVNLHALELGDDDLFEQTSELCRFSRRVVLEVTERSSLENVVDVGSRVARLRELGYRVAVDDLGAGYAGLTSFSQLEPDVAKLDMSLVRNIDTSKRKQSLVRSMVNVCERELGVQVVCEGVETEAERDTLESLGGTLLQGYLFGRPAPGFAPVQFLSTDSVVGDG